MARSQSYDIIKTDDEMLRWFVDMTKKAERDHADESESRARREVRSGTKQVGVRKTSLRDCQRVQQSHASR